VGIRPDRPSLLQCALERSVALRRESRQLDRKCGRRLNRAHVRPLPRRATICCGSASRLASVAWRGYREPPPRSRGARRRRTCRRSRPAAGRPGSRSSPCRRACPVPLATCGPPPRDARPPGSWLRFLLGEAAPAHFSKASASVAFRAARAMSPFLQAASAWRIRAPALLTRGAWISWVRGAWTS